MSNDITNYVPQEIIKQDVYNATDWAQWYLMYSALNNSLGSATTVLSGGSTKTIIGTLTRPADTAIYAAFDVVSNSTSATTPITIAGAARANGLGGYITGIRLATDKVSITPRFRVHFFNLTTITVSADNALYKEKYIDYSKRVGMIELPAMTTAADVTPITGSDMSRSLNFDIRIPFQCDSSSTSLYAVLETLDIFTPASGQLFALSVNVEQN